MKNFRILLVVTSLLFSVLAFAKNNYNKNKLIGSIIKNALETYHYKGLKVNDEISKNAFSEYLKKLDYGKQFFLKSDVKKLEKFKSKMDDQMLTGNHDLLKQAVEILNKRVKEVQAYEKEIFKTKFDFSKNEEIELDPDKRDYMDSSEDLKDHWRRLLKQSTLSRYLDLKDEQDDTKKDKDKKKKKTAKKKKKKEKKLTEKELWAKAYEAIDKKYDKYFNRLLEDTQDDHLDKFFNAVAGVFDPHTSYLPPKRKEDFDIDISGQLEGIGAVLQEDGSYIKVVKIVPGGAAWRQKELEVEDTIMQVAQKDDEPVSLVDMRVDDAVRYIRGKKGTEVRLHVKKVDGTKKIIPIIRDVVNIGASYAKSSVIEHKKLGVKVGYIHVPKFYRDFEGNKRNCSDDVKKELLRLKKSKIDAVILDLRGNGGGALEDARQMSGLFIEKGPIVQIKDHRGNMDVLKDTDKSITYDGPLIVMVNRFSASASEILAGAMQDYKRAIVIGGEYSHGKGTVQAVLNLNHAPLLSMFGPTMGALKVTIQKFYRVTGASTQYKGITPDIIYPDPMGYAKNREQDLEFSLKWDAVPGLAYDDWTKQKYNLDVLRKRSKDRVGKSSRFKLIQESVNYLRSRRDDTKVSLNLKTVQKENKDNEEMSKKFKMDDLNKEILVSHYEESLKDAENIRPGDEEKWKEDLKQRKEEWVESLQKDTGLEEALFLAADMVDMSLGKKLGMR